MSNINTGNKHGSGEDRFKDQSAELMTSAPSACSFTEVLSYPNLDHYREKNYDLLSQEFNANHKILLAYLKNNKLRYFGMHGTDAAGLQGIINNPITSVAVATFYDKVVSNKRLFQLYHAIAYVQGYAVGNQDSADGGILLFDLEKNNKNISSKYEFLKPGAFPPFGILGDSKQTSKLLKGFMKTSNLLHRGDTVLSRDFMDKSFLGVVGAEAYNEWLQVKGLGSSIDNYLFAQRFFAQKTLWQIFTLMENRTDT